MTIEVTSKEFADLKRRVELAETRIAQQAGTFEFITGQLRDVQLYMYAKFAELDARFDRLDQRFDRMEAKMDQKIGELKNDMDQQFAGVNAQLAALKSQMDALPRIIAEMIAKR